MQIDKESVIAGRQHVQTQQVHAQAGSQIQPDQAKPNPPITNHMQLRRRLHQYY